MYITNYFTITRWYTIRSITYKITIPTQIQLISHTKLFISCMNITKNLWPRF